MRKKPLDRKELDQILLSMEGAAASYMRLQQTPEWKKLQSDLRLSIIQEQARVINLHGAGRHEEAQQLAAMILAKQWLIEFPETKESTLKAQMQNVSKLSKALRKDS